MSLTTFTCYCKILPYSVLIEIGYAVKTRNDFHWIRLLTSSICCEIFFFCLEAESQITAVFSTSTTHIFRRGVATWLVVSLTQPCTPPVFDSYVFFVLRPPGPPTGWLEEFLWAKVAPEAALKNFTWSEQSGLAFREWLTGVWDFMPSFFHVEMQSRFSSCSCQGGILVHLRVLSTPTCCLVPMLFFVSVCNLSPLLWYRVVFLIC